MVLVVWLCESFGALRWSVRLDRCHHDVLVESGADVEARVHEVRASERSARMVLVVWLCESFGLCVARFAVVSSTGSVSWHVDTTFSWRAAVRT